MLRLKYERREHLKEVRWPSVASHRRCLCSGASLPLVKDLIVPCLRRTHQNAWKTTSAPPQPTRPSPPLAWSSTWPFVLRHPAVVVSQAPSLALWRRAPSLGLSPSAGRRPYRMRKAQHQCSMRTSTIGAACWPSQSIPLSSGRLGGWYRSPCRRRLRRVCRPQRAPRRQRRALRPARLGRRAARTERALFALIRWR